MGGTLVDEPAAPMGDGGPATHPAERPARRRRLGPVGVVAAVGLLVIATAGIGLVGFRYHEDHLAGTTRSVTLTWTCENNITWDQPHSNWTWWAGHDVVIPAHFDTATSPSPSDGTGFPVHRASGRLHVDSTTRASFTSDAGGVIHLTRYGSPFFQTADCRISS